MRDAEIQSITVRCVSCFCSRLDAPQVTGLALCVPGPGECCPRPGESEEPVLLFIGSYRAGVCWESVRLVGG